MIVDYTHILFFLTCLAALGGVGLGWYNAIQIRRVYNATNGMKAELVAEVKKSSVAEGVKWESDRRDSLDSGP